MIMCFFFSRIDYQFVRAAYTEREENLGLKYKGEIFEEEIILIRERSRYTQILLSDA